MALINGIYVHVESEDVDRTVDKSTHAVEQGIDITDTIRPQAMELSISGKIVDYTGYTEVSSETASGQNVWISLVKKDYSKFETMSFERLNNELITFENGTRWIDTGAVQYYDDTLNPVNAANGNDGDVLIVKFEVYMPYGGTVRVQNAYTEYLCFNVINKSSTTYAVQDYNADASDEEISDVVLSNTYNGESGRIRTTFTNLDTETDGTTTPSVDRTASWVIEQLAKFWANGSLITYEGRNYLQNYQIKSFSTSHPNTVSGGAEFSMTLEECRTGINSYGIVATDDETVDDSISSGSTQQITEGDNSEVWYTVQEGDTVNKIVEEYSGLTRAPINGITYSDMAWIMVTNPWAFSTYGDYSTLKGYVDILVGTR